MLSVKYLSLQKSELEYEVRIRGATPASSVEELRKQIVKLSKDFPSEHILESPLKPRQDLHGCLEVLTKIQSNLDIADTTAPILMRTQNMLNHLYNRIARIIRSDEIKKEYDEVVKEFDLLTKKFKTLQANKPFASNSGACSTSSFESGLAVPELQNVISVTCDRTSADLAKLKFNGTTCVRSFIQRVDEFIKARNIPTSKIFNYSTEIFQDNALHWYRSVRDKVDSWSELAALLRKDFDQSDYDYRLDAEIRARTQGERESITIYLSIMDGMFSRLSNPPSEAEKLRILLHNIRPCYASTLASVASISDIESLRTLCRNYENVQARLSQFQEPPKVTSNTVAPEFAYAADSNKNTNKYSSHFNRQTFTNTNNYNKHYSYKQQNNNQNTSKPQQQNYIHSVQTNKNLPYCPRCRNNTHHIRQCQASREIVCFKCGMKDVKTPDCPVCSKGKKEQKN
ncbi:uncharacterized protein LOC133527644 [Cydia pomonella]|uniref:uncharacterized protein LOC133527644 n=1 Tax=Cydia pomonella TaxID=82600 RepID=UPI002ADDFFC1|nr:uncharacterized protein LOC133527644 [Cydia pomonella]